MLDFTLASPSAFRVPSALSALSSAFLFLLIVSCEGIRKQPGLLEAVGVLPPPPTDLSVMSFNIRYGTASDGANAWPKRRDLLLDTIAADNPDVLCLQEALRFQIDELLVEMPWYTEYAVGRDDGRSAGEHCAILIRAARFRLDRSGTFWLSDTPDVAGSKSWGNDITRICSWVRLIEKPGGRTGEGGPGGRAFYVFNTHLDHRSEPSRQKSAELIALRIANRDRLNDPVILAGDFNCGEQSPAIRFLTGQSPSPIEQGTPTAGWAGLADSYRSLHPDDAEVGTFHAFKGTTSGEKIDFILVSRDVRVRSAAIIRAQRDGRFPSDHFAVMADLTLSADATAPPYR